MNTRIILPILLCLLTGSSSLWAQSRALLYEETQAILTYPYSDPNPVAILPDNPKIYPYHRFEGYSHTGEMQDWKLVVLENDYIKVWVLPDAGGKVYGAVDKSTGEEFIYRNEVMKFRNIAMRGPWTSGGIEFNFGIIGHTPSTAASVDYTLLENEDGSVSCWVGNLDLPSRTHWRVEVRLEPDKAYFETHVLWYNPTPLTQSYYNWMTGAAAAREDLEFFCPGDAYVEHNGKVRDWPYDEAGRHIAEYKENHFGPSKSYHVVGEYNNFFGGYFHEKEVGFGHLSDYQEMPGQKLWLWALSRSGGIWEDLLTDTDGQYIEFQAGRLLDQYSPGGDHNPITQVPFEPGRGDEWREYWFPVKETGGISAVSSEAVIHLRQMGDSVRLSGNALAAFSSASKLYVNGRLVAEEMLDLQPGEIWHQSLSGKLENIQVEIPGADISYQADPASRSLKRPFQSYELGEAELTASQHFFAAQEAYEFRQYPEALGAVRAALERDAYHVEARSLLAELYYRQAEYEKGLAEANKVLQRDTYHAAANFLAGICYQALGEESNALESLGWAARSTTYRSVAYQEMARTALQFQRNAEAYRYAQLAISYDPNAMLAYWMAGMAALRLKGPEGLACAELDELYRRDPLYHLSRSIDLLWGDGSDQLAEQFNQDIQNEFQFESYLEMAFAYRSIGEGEKAETLLRYAGDQVKIGLLRAYAARGTEAGQTLLEVVLTQPADFVFPYRPEMLPVMQWAYQQAPSWKTRYYLALNLWALSRKEEAVALLRECGQEPDFSPFYALRARVQADPLPDLEKAWQLDPGPRSAHQLSQAYLVVGQYDKARQTAGKALEKHPAHYTLQFDLATAYLRLGQYQACIDQLAQTQMLPYEGAGESRVVYEEAHLMAAIEALHRKSSRKALTLLHDALLWPEHLGVGKPYAPDERLEQALMALAYEQRGKESLAQPLWRAVLDASLAEGGLGFRAYLGLLAAKKLNDPKGEARLLQILTRHQDQGGNAWVLAQWQGRGEAAQEWKAKEDPVFDRMDFRVVEAIRGLVD